jgi:hypothetical protein
MRLLSRVINQAYVQRAINQLRAEHDEWVREAATQLGTPYWTIAPMFAAADNAMADAYDIHGGPYVFTRYSRSHPSQLVTKGGLRSWEIWYRNGPMTTVPQQTSASWHAAHAAGHAAELAHMQERFAQHATAELGRLYPASVKALVNA